MSENTNTEITKIKSHGIDITQDIFVSLDEVVTTIKGQSQKGTNFNISRVSYDFVSIEFSYVCSIKSLVGLSRFMAILQSFTRNQLTKEPYTIITDIYMKRETVENTEVLTLCFKKKKIFSIDKPGTQHILNILNKVYGNLSLTTM